MMMRRHKLTASAAMAGALLLTAAVPTPAPAQDDGQDARFRRAFSAENFRLRDKDNDGNLTRQEFLLNADADSPLGRVRAEYFQRADLDNDGVISRREAQQVATGRTNLPAPEGVTTIRLSAQEREQLRDAFSQENWRLRDKNNDGQLTLEEFRHDARGERLIAFRDKLFAWADEDHDGIVTREEVGTVLRRGYVTPAVEPDAPQGDDVIEDITSPSPAPRTPAAPASEIARLDIPLTGQLMQRMDRDNDGSISQSEFAGDTTGRNAERANKAFSRMDRDNNGQLSAQELQYGLFDNGLVGAPATSPDDESEAAAKWREHVNRLYARADDNNDGRLSLEELTDHYGQDRANEARSLLYRRDANADGFLTRDEMQRDQ